MTTDIQPMVTETPLVSITPRAAERARAMLLQREMPQAMLRVFIAGGGCSGYQYGMAIAEQPEPDDTVLEQEGVRIVIDHDSAPLIGGAEIDFVEDLMKSGFTIFNPNATSACACGSSFSASGGTPRACHS